jgi:hypothetical protein
MKRAEFEGLANDPAASVEERREHVKAVHLRAAVHEVSDSCGGAADPDVVADG